MQHQNASAVFLQALSATAANQQAEGAATDGDRLTVTAVLQKDRTEAYMAADPSTMTDPTRIRVLMQNALDRNEEGLARLCLRRIFELGGVDQPDPLVRRLWQAVTAYEETLRAKLGRSQRETRVRKKIATKGALATLSDWATAKDVTPGFLAVIDAGMAEFTGEYIILEYADSFDEAVVQAARIRLEGFGVALPKSWRSRLT